MSDYFVSLLILELLMRIGWALGHRSRTAPWCDNKYRTAPQVILAKERRRVHELVVFTEIKWLP
jgi:hypothetical protein